MIYFVLGRIAFQDFGINDSDTISVEGNLTSSVFSFMIISFSCSKK